MATESNSKEPKKRTSRFSDMLLQVTTDLAKTKSLDEALETLVKSTTSTIGAERGTIFLTMQQLANYIPVLHKEISKRN